jgi:hypothetical protein
MKCIILLEGGVARKNHNLWDLFSKLSSSTKARLQSRWKNDFAPKRATQLDLLEQQRSIKIPRDLISLLKLGGTTFEDVRYAHERQPRGNFYLSDLPDLLREIIIEMKPEWA